ncbi:MAG: sugar-binding domain-containing protein [Ginsengibacter sp.]
MFNISNKLLAVLLLMLPAVAFTQSNSWNVRNTELEDGWQIQSSEKVPEDDEKISGVKFKHAGWYVAKVPNSTLGTLVDDGVFKNIFFNRNLEKIPVSLFTAPWWYRRTFMIDKTGDGQFYRLRFDGISYSADIWLNGEKIASGDTVKGSFRQFIFDITPYIKKGENVLALKVKQGGPGDLNIGFVDWNPEPADNHMGIWRDVHLMETGPVSLDQPFVTTDVDTATLDHANITLKVKLENHSAKKLDGILKTTIGDDIHLSTKVSLNANESKEIILTPEEYKSLRMDHPKLWWTYDL